MSWVDKEEYFISLDMVLQFFPSPSFFFLFFLLSGHATDLTALCDCFIFMCVGL